MHDDALTLRMTALQQRIAELQRHALDAPPQVPALLEEVQAALDELLLSDARLRAHSRSLHATQHDLERRLAEAETRYRTIAGLTADFAYGFRVTPEGVAVPIWIAGAFTAITGYDPQEILQSEQGLPLIHPDDHELARQHVARLLAGHEDVAELRIVTKTRQTRWIRDSGRPQADPDSGRVIGIVGAVSDMTACKEAELALQESEARFRLALDGSPVVVFNQDLDLRYTWIYNPHRGYAVREVIGRQDADLFPPEAAADLTAVKRRVLATGVGAREEVNIREGSATACYDLRVEPLRNAAGAIVGITCSATDVTKLKQAQAAVLESQRRIENILESIGDAYYVIDRDWRCVYLNRAAELLLKRGREQLLGRDIRQVFDDEASAPFIRQYQRAMDEGVTVAFEERYPPLGVWVEVRVLPAEGGGITVYQRDITARRRAERARSSLLQRLVTAQEDERRRLSHELHDELGRYLTALQLGLSALPDPGPSDPATAARLKQLRELTAALGQDLHVLARRLRPAALDDLGLRAALDNYVEEWSAQYGIAAEIQWLGLDAPRLPMPIETALYRVVQEALTNIARHAHARRVSLILERRNQHVQLIVEDDGRGFDAERLLDAPETERGLGLIGMQERVALLGGSVTIESFPGSGTAIFIRIAVPSEPEAVDDEAARSAGR